MIKCCYCGSKKLISAPIIDSSANKQKCSICGTLQIN